MSLYIGVSKDMQLKCGTKECTMPTRGINGNDDTDWKTTQGWVYCLATLLVGERRSDFTLLRKVCEVSDCTVVISIVH